MTISKINRELSLKSSGMLQVRQ